MFLAMFGISTVCALCNEDEKDRRIEIASSVVFLSFGGGGLLWPILRKKEFAAIRTEYVHSFEMHCEAVVFPMSRVKQFIIIGSAAVLSIGAGGLTFFADNNEARVKGIIGFIFCVCIVILGMKSLLAGRKGIFLVPDGIIWNEMFRAPCFLPWENISQSAFFLKKEKGSLKPVWTFGINVSDPALVQTSYWSRKKLSESKMRHGWYFYFFQETILFPLEVVAKTVEFYCQHPETRGEIGTSNSLARIKAFEETTLSS